ncbi:MAG: acetolactate synthase [Planctomycetes bacterium]|nr:acetolactate synthase [Planctomycetota bacterium]
MIQSSRGFQEPYVRQLTFFLQNKVGEIGDVLRTFRAENIVVHALSVLDSFDFAVVRMVVDKTDKCLRILKDAGLSASENSLIGVQLPDDGSSLLDLCRALLSAELNLHTMYPLLTRPGGQGVILIYVDNPDLGVEILDQRGFRIIGHAELRDPNDDTERGAW